METPIIIGAELDIQIISGRGLVAKDGGLMSRKSSDPFVKIGGANTNRRQWSIGKTKVISKSLDPTWNEGIKFHFDHLQAKGLTSAKKVTLVFSVFDFDTLSADDPMGEVRIELSTDRGTTLPAKWYPVVPGQSGCKKAKGELQFSVSLVMRRAVWLNRGEALSVGGGQITLGMGWEMLRGGKAIDLDTSCVGVDAKGKVLMDETVYFADLVNSNKSIVHTGDEREGDEDLGGGDDERISVDLDRVPANVRALFFIGTVATEGHSFADVKTSRMRIVGPDGGEMARYEPALGGAHTAVFMCRIARNRQAGGQLAGWTIQTIGDFDHTARDFGTLVPEMKAYMSDLVPGIRVDPTERVAVMRKGGNVMLSDYTGGGASGGGGAVGAQQFVMGLAWDVTNGVNIDLDVSVIMLDQTLKAIDLVSFRKLRSSDGSIQHCGDEREGDEKGDDEKVIVNLAAVHPAVRYVGFVVNSYSGQELDDVKDASCHLYDPSTIPPRDVATYKMTGTKELNGHTALLMGMLYRDPSTSEWALRIIAEPAQGRVAEDNIDELQRHLQRCPPQPLQKRAFHRDTSMMNMPPPPPAGPPQGMQPGMQQMIVECPPGVQPGQSMSIATPEGAQLMVTVPAGVGPGGRFAVSVPAPTAGTAQMM